MEPGFLRSKQFAVAAALAFVVLAFGVVAVGTSSFGVDYGHYYSGGCRERFAAGTPVDLNATTSDADARRVLRWELDTTAFSQGGLDLCIASGEVLVESTQSDRATLEVRISGGDAQTRGRIPIHAEVGVDGDRLNIAVWQGAFEERSFSSFSVPSIMLVVQVPESIVYDAKLASSDGDVRISGLRLSDLVLKTSSGEARGLGLMMEGDVTAESSWGSVILGFASVQTGNITAESHSENVEVALPLRADVGYDVAASTRTGDVLVRIGDAETYETESRGVGGETRVRSAGYDSKPTQVQVSASTGHGDVRVTAS